MLGGKEPQHELPLIDIGLAGTSITFPPGTRLANGEMFEITRPFGMRADFAPHSRGPRKVVALVKITGIEKEGRVHVEVIGGSLRRGVWAERFDDHRIAAHLYHF